MSDQEFLLFLSLNDTREHTDVPLHAQSPQRQHGNNQNNLFDMVSFQMRFLAVVAFLLLSSKNDCLTITERLEDLNCTTLLQALEDNNLLTILELKCKCFSLIFPKASPSRERETALSGLMTSFVSWDLWPIHCTEDNRSVIFKGREISFSTQTPMPRIKFKFPSQAKHAVPTFSARKGRGRTPMQFLCSPALIPFPSVADVTLFAPTDDAMVDLPGEAELEKVLKYHAIPERLRAYQLKNERVETSLFNESDIRFNIYGKVSESIFLLVRTNGHRKCQCAELFQSVSSNIFIHPPFFCLRTRKAFIFISWRKRKDQWTNAYSWQRSNKSCMAPNVSTFCFFSNVEQLTNWKGPSGRKRSFWKRGLCTGENSTQIQLPICVFARTIVDRPNLLGLQPTQGVLVQRTQVGLCEEERELSVSRLEVHSTAKSVVSFSRCQNG